MTSARQKSVRAMLNAFFDDVYHVLDPISDPETILEAIGNDSWKAEWNRIKQFDTMTTTPLVQLES